MSCKYKVGDKVLIKPYEYLRGHYLADEYDEMADGWGGEVMTIKSCHDVREEYDDDYEEEYIYYHMLEDSGSWCWYEALIECLVGPNISVNADDLLDFIGA